MPTLSRNAEQELVDLCAEYYADPLRWVLAAFPWGEAKGPIAQFKEPLAWQCEFLEWLGGEIRARKFNGIDPVLAIRGAVASGHGTGKGALSGMLNAFIMSTRRDAKGVITANTNAQLQDKTWAAIMTWAKRAITAHWFELNTSIMYRVGFRESWKCTPQTCAPENSDAFAGQHNVKSTSYYINDEDSSVPDEIHEVQEGGLTDGEPMYFLFGNPTRRSGAFYSNIFGEMRKRWKIWIIDSRTVEITNKAQIAEWVQDYGEDSDFVRVRVRGLPPRASDAQFIDQERILGAQKRQVGVLGDEPLVCGCDLAWGGGDDNVIRFRRGHDARSLPPIRIKGEFTRDPSVLTGRLADVLTRDWGGQRVHTLFLDSAGIAGAIGHRLRQLGHRNVIDVNFGADSPDEQCRYMRDYMWQQMKQWLLVGAIDASPDLETDLAGPGYKPDRQNRIWLEDKESMKKRGLDSPDDADALALTFAMPVSPKRELKLPVPMPINPHVPGGWMGL